MRMMTRSYRYERGQGKGKGNSQESPEDMLWMERKEKFKSLNQTG